MVEDATMPINDEEKTVQERCREYYPIGSFVVVMNIDTQPHVYQVQRIENQAVNEEGVHRNIENVKPAERITMQPGDMRLVPAYEADLMIKSLMDRIIYRNRAKHIELHKHDETPTPPTESVRDPATQRKYISAIYQGTRNFLDEFNSKHKEQMTDDIKAENMRLKEELERLKKAQGNEDNEPKEDAPRRPGRPSKQTV